MTINAGITVKLDSFVMNLQFYGGSFVISVYTVHFAFYLFIDLFVHFFHYSDEYKNSITQLPYDNEYIIISRYFGYKF